MASVKKREGYGWEVRYIDPATGKRPSKTFELKKDADAYKRKVQREIEDGIHLATPKQMTVRDVCEKYIEEADARASRGEIGKFRAKRIALMVRGRICPIIGHVVFKEITPAQVDDLYAQLCKRLQPFVARDTLSNLGTIERFAVRRRYLLTTPVATAARDIKRVKPTRIREFSRDQVMDLLALALQKPKHKSERQAAMLACFVHLAACCGLRIGECRALDWTSVDLEAGMLTISRNMLEDGELKTTKTPAGVRDVPMPAHLTEMLSLWRQRFMVETPDKLVFPSKTGGPMWERGIRRNWYDLLKATGLFDPNDVFHFHSLRHFAGSWWLHNGMAIQDVSRQLGHSDAAITLRVYAHSVSRLEDRRAAMCAMGGQLLRLSDAQVTQAA